MTAQYHSILGLPRSGKTTFLAALWHLIDAGEVSTKFVLDQLVGDHEYLNKIVDAWRRCEEVPRTSRADEAQIAIHVSTPENGQRVILKFPDLSGESFSDQFSRRTCTAEYVDSYDNAGGVLLFVNADRGADGMTIADITATIGATNESAETQDEKEWTPDLVPEQVRLVDLLQFLQRPPFVRRCRRMAVVISAWDAVIEPKPSPDEWLVRELPLLHQFLVNNPDSFEVRVYGVSAQGGDVTGSMRLELAQRTPSERIQCVGPDANLHDLTTPLSWLTEGS